MKSFSKIALILLVSTFSFTQAFAQTGQEVELRSLGEISNIELEKDYAYYLFKVNQDYLVWYEGYTATLFMYEFTSEKLSKIQLKEGRGPNEFKVITDLAVHANNIVELVDFNNIKFISIKPDGEYLEDVRPPEGVRPMRLSINRNYSVVMDVVNQNALFYERRADNYRALTLKDATIFEEFPNPFQKEGFLTLNEKYLVHLTRYYPRLYIYDLERMELFKTIMFDESEVKESQSAETDEGAQMLLPPEEVDILNEDVAHLPGLPGRILMLAKGKSDTRDYMLNTLLEYDFLKEEFVSEHGLGVEATEITVTEKYLFVYSEEENAVFQYEIIYSE